MGIISPIRLNHHDYNHIGQSKSAFLTLTLQLHSLTHLFLSNDQTSSLCNTAQQNPQHFFILIQMEGKVHKSCLTTA